MSQSSRIVSAPFAVLFALCASLVLSGCGDSVSGTYSASAPDGGTFSIQFKSGGTATVNLMGMTREGTYTVKGGTVTVMIDNHPAVFVKQKDGSLLGQGEMAVALKKQD